MRRFLHSSQRTFSTAAKLHHEGFLKSTSKTVDPSIPTLAVFHGILGNHKNLRRLSHDLAKAVQAKRKDDFQALLVTHRSHGESETGEAPHTVQSCANDAFSLLKNVGFSEKQPEVLMGHSFGGKVILALLASMDAAQCALPKHVILLDSIPFSDAISSEKKANVEQKFDDSVLSIIQRLKEVEQPISSKDELISQLSEKFNFPKSIGMWLTTSLTKNARPSVRDKTKKGYFFSFDLEVCEKLLKDFIKLDMSDIIKDSRFKNVNFTLVRAGKNISWDSAEIEDRLESELLIQNNVEVVLLENSGHWVHVDEPDLLVQILSEKITRSL